MCSVHQRNRRDEPRECFLILCNFSGQFISFLQLVFAPPPPLQYYGKTKNGTSSCNFKCTSMRGHVPISCCRLKALWCCFMKLLTLNFCSFVDLEYLRLTFRLTFFTFYHHWYNKMEWYRYDEKRS